MDEFDLIQRFFSAAAPERSDVHLGIGDDAALAQVPEGHQLAIATDTLVEGVHFPVNMPPDAVGYRVLAVNLSDLAAMGALPAWASLALTLPDADRDWLAGFASGFGELARAHGIALLGGDTTRGPRSITLTVHGFVEPGQALTRAGAKIGDRVCVTGALGSGAAGLQAFMEGRAGSHSRFLRPHPRIDAGRALRGHAHAAIDISDGFLADLGHILVAGGVGAEIDTTAIPLGPDASLEQALGGGDDYELCCCVPPAQLDDAVEAVRATGTTLVPVGKIVAGSDLHCLDAKGTKMKLPRTGYRHFG